MGDSVASNRREREKELRRRMTATASAALLYVVPCALVVKAVIRLVFADIVGAGVSLALFVVFALGAMATRAGIARAVRIEAGQRRSASPLPMKAIGGALYGMGAFLTAFLMVGHDPLKSLLFTAGAFLGVMLTYGWDPYPKPGSLPEGAREKYFRDALAEADRKITALEKAGDEIGQRELRQHIHRLADIARDVIGAIEEDPKDLAKARKFLNVYLDNGLAIIQRYAETHRRTETGVLEEKFRTLLTEMERTFEETYRKLLENDLNDLDIHIEVLQTRMKREGVI